MDAFIWNINPTIAHLGPFQLRYYGLIFATMLYIGFVIWKKQALRGGYSVEIADKYLMWGVIGVLAGSRIGHCFFYEPERYLSNPISILYFWKGGLSSHGATIGVILSLIFFSLKYKLGVFETLDRMTMPSAVGAAAVRLGNFFNSEIVGRPTDLPWAVRFPLNDCRSLQPCEAAVPRHPTQLYEFAFGMFVLLSLYLADKIAGKEKRPVGMMTGLFLGLYFFGRFMIEFVKEYQAEWEVEASKGLTAGQYLSIIPCVVGIGIFIYAVKAQKHNRNYTASLASPATPSAPPSASAAAAPARSSSPSKGKSKKKRR